MTRDGPSPDLGSRRAGSSPFGPPPAPGRSCWCRRGRWRASRAAGRWEAGWDGTGLGGHSALRKVLSWSLRAVKSQT